MADNLELTDKQLKAGADVFARAAWQIPRANPEAAAERIYRAMCPRTPTPPVGDVVERVAREPTAKMKEAAQRIEEDLRYYRKRGINPDTITLEVRGADLRQLLAHFHFPNADWEALRSIANPNDHQGHTHER